MEEVKNWINRKRLNGKSWDEIKLACKNSEEELRRFLRTKTEDDDWPELTIGQWQDIVKEAKEKADADEKRIDEKGATVIYGNNEINEISIPTDEYSAWQTYKRKLQRKGFSPNTIDVIEGSAIKTIRGLSRDTRDIGAIKGLVVGNVQSGKTANMAALMAIAADYGWNMFIVLSGMMNNLREQTMRRLISDLDGSEWEWDIVDNPRAVEECGRRLRDKRLGENDRRRYLSVCIKNSRRLSNLVNWMFRDQAARSNVKLLIIDDEADQASINTNNENENEKERTAINRLILNLINNKDSGGKRIATTPFKAVNYIGYTATPYANVLNESPGVDSLYPKDFIATLDVSDEYFGPQQIFGFSSDDGDSETEYNGLDIVRNIPDNDVDNINEIHNGSRIDLPSTLKDAIEWFICGVAYMRFNDYRKPVSMLIHTSRRVDEHNCMYNAIDQWFRTTSKKTVIRECRSLWEQETRRFTKENFLANYPNYSQRNGLEVSTYLSFGEIKPFIEGLLKEGTTNIGVNADGHRRYSDGIHVCVDNSRRNDDGEEVSRLVYPEDDEMPELAPAFLVIGGNTLSRGLTIEGLVSTFFMRPVGCADTLMQMGRWFGYRRGYELIPRIWMPAKTREEFEFIAEMDQKLRDDIKQNKELGISPAACGPKIMASPFTKELLIVSNNKSQAAIGADYDFSGQTIETGVFDNDFEKLQSNLDVTGAFIRRLGARADIQNNPYARYNTVWRGVSLDMIRGYLRDYKFSERLNAFQNLDKLIEWLDKVTEDRTFGEWSVILAGKSNTEGSDVWSPSEGVSVSKVSRTQRGRERPDNVLNIGALRSPDDFLSDIEFNGLSDSIVSEIKEIKHEMRYFNRLREKIGMASTPQLVIYIIDKDSIPRENSKNRHPLNACNDVVGISINIPGFRNGNTIRSFTINLNLNGNVEEEAE